LWLGLTDNLWLCYLALTGFGLFRGIYDSNLFAAQFDVVRPQLRSSAVGIMLAFGFMVGAVGPWLLGWIKATRGLTFGMASLSVVYLAAAVCMFIALKAFFPRDYCREVVDET
jgi:fucose permease